MNRAKWLPTLLLALAPWLAKSVTAADVPIPGFVKEERYDGKVRADLEDPTFSGTPDVLRILPSFEVPVNQADNFAERVSAIFTPTQSGNYVFFVCSDDDSDLFLSTDDTPANKKLIASETAWSNNRQWLTSGGSSDLTAKRSDQNTTSQWPTGNTITLTAGKKYYIEAIHHEGGGGDDLSATFKLDSEPDPADGTPTRLTGTLVQTSGPDPGIKITIGTQPTDLSIQEQLQGTFSASATGTAANGSTPTLFYQWQQKAPGASAFTDIPGATNPSFTTAALALAQAGTQYRLVVTAPGASVTSSAATLTVVPDTFPPKVLSAGSLQNGNDNSSQVTVVFDEPLKDAATATTLSNYSLSGGATISAASYVTNAGGLSSRQSGVLLTATGVTPGQSYTLTVKGLADLKNNAMTGSTNLTFTASPYSWVAIGDQGKFTPAAFAVGTNGFNLVSGGNSFWGTEDDITMVYQPVTGDFDKIAQVEYTDPASNWARSGISARESLNTGGPTTDAAGTNPASRYQMIISDPSVKYDGTAGNNSYETNRRLNTGGATTSTNGGGNPLYPNSWVRLKRVGQVFSMFYSSDGNRWQPLGNTDFGSTDWSDTPMPDKLFVGPTYGPENGNVTDDNFKSLWVTRMRNYGNEPQLPRGTQAYAIGLNFGSDEGGGALSTNDVAGVEGVAQGHWNNLPGQNTPDAGPVSGIVAEKQGGASEATPVTVEWASNNTWASTGARGENNNLIPGNNGILMTGYLDTGAATTSHVTITNIPAALTSATNGYDLYVYSLGGVDSRGGGFRVLDGSGTVLKDNVLVQGPKNPTGFVGLPATPVAGATNTANFIKFSGLKAASITIEASTENGLGISGTPRAPINAIQLVAGGGTTAGGGGTISAARSASGIHLTFTGTLQSADAITGPWTDVANAASPLDQPVSGKAKFYRTK